MPARRKVKVAPKIDLIQEALKKASIPAWLFYDFRDQDPFAKRILLLSPKKNRTRRWFYFVPAQGDPVKLVHRVEPDALDEIPGENILYSGKTELEDMLKRILSSVDRVAMQYSPMSNVPYISRVDAGTLELIRSFGLKIISSGDLIQFLEATWSKKELEMHRHAAYFLMQCVRDTFDWIALNHRKHDSVSELSAQEFLMKRFNDEGFITNHPPIVAVNQHSANPHYSPEKKTNAPINNESLILLDLWCKKNEPHATYADITWVGYLGAHVPKKIQDVFSVVSEARDKAIDFIRGRVLANHPVFGYEIDDKARHFINSKGYAEAFTHRTGHSIGQEVHWLGANIDNFETAEQRRIIPKTCFSIEPGIYLKEFGIRSEVDVYIDEQHVEVNPREIQKEVYLLGTYGKGRI